MTMNTADENFSVEFSGPALEGHEISAAALAQSLLALDRLARRAAEAAYGRDADVSVKVKGKPRPGSFIIDLIIQHPGEALASGAAAVTILMGVIALGKWALGKKVEKLGEEPDGTVSIRNEAGNLGNVNIKVVHIYNQSRTLGDLSRLTQALDREGVESIAFTAPHGARESISKAERSCFRREEGLVLSDNEALMELEITGARFNGSPNGWIFNEGEDGREFTAKVEDEDFLQAVRDNRILIGNGTSVLAVIRTVQKKQRRVLIERSIVEVLEVHSSRD